MDHGTALLRVLTMVDALERAGWGVVLDGWHAGLLAVAVGQRPDPRGLAMVGAPEAPTGPWATAARHRWHGLCTRQGVPAEDPASAAAVLEALGVLRRRRLLVFTRWAVTAPLPPAAGCALLDAEARALAPHAIRRYEVGAAVGAVLDEGGGVGEVGPLPAAGIDAGMLAELAAEPDVGWTVADLGRGRVRIEQRADPERDAMIAEIDAAPDPDR